MSLLRTSAPPTQAVELQRWLLLSGDELRALRHGLRDALTSHRLIGPTAADEVAERVVLVATELASNALRHGLPPALVCLLRCDDEYFIDVSDRDLESLPKLAVVNQAGAGGRGLHIARTLSLEVCWFATGTAKHVWASFPVLRG